VKPFRILHTADLQLGKQQYGSFLRTQDFAAVLPQIASIAEDEKVDLIVLAGDIFDSYNPDAFSERAFRKFVDEVQEQERHVSILAIEGNHEFDKRNQGGRKARIDAVTSGIVRPDSVFVASALGPKPWPSIVAADWMPATKLQDFLDGLPIDLDILVMHQSCEGFIPGIGNTELKLDQLKNKAKLVLLGDLHVCDARTLDGGTIVTYPGSTELCSSNENPHKSVNIINYDMENRKVVDIRPIPLETRRVLKLRVFDELSLNDADLEIRRHAAVNPIVFIEQNSKMRPLVDQKMEEWTAQGLTLIYPETIVKVEETESYVYTRDSADREMESIVGDNLADHPSEREAAVALWKTPGAAADIVKQLEQQIRQSHENTL
jgi:DNA repair exonuclease SbcCD nuclease subunit